MPRYRVTGVAVYTSVEAGNVGIEVEADSAEDAADEALNELQRKERSGIMSVEWAEGEAPKVMAAEEETEP